MFFERIFDRALFFDSEKDFVKLTCGDLKAMTKGADLKLANFEKLGDNNNKFSIAHVYLVETTNPPKKHHVQVKNF